MLANLDGLSTLHTMALFYMTKMSLVRFMTMIEKLSSVAKVSSMVYTARIWAMKHGRLLEYGV